MPRLDIPLRLLLSVVALAALAVGSAPAGAAAGPTATTTVMTVQSLALHQPYAWQDPCCFGVDDFLNWTVTGQIAPGDSYTFAPPWPTSSASELPDMSASLRWSGSTLLRLTSVVPMNGEVTGAEPAVNHVGQTITAPVIGNTAALCMFFDPAATNFSYAITVTNVGSVAATSVTLSGQESNGYTANYGQFCNHADADGDGWNDTLEQGMFDLTSPAVTTSGQAMQNLGTDYLATRPGDGVQNDEVDSYPPDVNDDGTVDQADVDTVDQWIGQGTGVPFARVDYTGVGANRYQVQSGLWRRYDFNGDGWVTAADAAWVAAEIGRPEPDPMDVIPPWVAFDRSVMPSSISRRSTTWIGANARDNRALVAVRFAVNGSALTQQCTSPATEMASPVGYDDPGQPEYRCPWTAPSKAGPVTLTVSATDAAGNTSQDSTVVYVS